MTAYIFSALLIGGFYYLTFKNSPKHANLLLLMVAISFGIGLIEPREKSTLIGLAFGIVSVFVLIIRSRKARERTVQKWFLTNGFRRITFPAVAALFKTPATDNIAYFPYEGKMAYNGQTITFIQAIRYSSTPSGKYNTVILDCSYYFKENVPIDLLEQKFKIAQENTPHTNLWKSHMRFFDLKDCEIFKPAMGGIVVSWRLPDSIGAYGERFQWIKNALQY